MHKQAIIHRPHLHATTFTDFSLSHCLYPQHTAEMLGSGKLRTTTIAHFQHQQLQTGLHTTYKTTTPTHNS